MITAVITVGFLIDGALHFAGALAAVAWMLLAAPVTVAYYVIYLNAAREPEEEVTALAEAGAIELGRV